MGIFRQFPYTNFHEMNLDWLLSKVKELSEDWLTYQTNINKWVEDTDKAFKDLYDYVINYFEENNVKALVLEYVTDYLNELKETGYFDDLINNMLQRTKQAQFNVVGSGYYEYTEDCLPDGSCYIGNNRCAVYFTSNSDTGTLRIFNMSDWSMLVEKKLQLYHGNSLTYKDGYIYACGCYKVSNTSRLIPNVVKVDVSNVFDMKIVEEIELPVPAPSTGLYSLTYDATTDLFYAIVFRGTVAGSFNKVVVYNSNFAIVNEFLLPEAPTKSGQGIQLAHNNILYQLIYDASGRAVITYDATNGSIINVYNVPTIINNYRNVGEIESLIRNSDTGDFYLVTRYVENGTPTMRGYSIINAGLYKNIPINNLNPRDPGGKDTYQTMRVVAPSTALPTTGSVVDFTSLMDAINYCKSNNLYGNIYVVEGCLIGGDLDIEGFNGIIQGQNGSNWAEFVSGSKCRIYNSNIRFTHCRFNGSSADKVTGVEGCINVVNSKITLVNCTSDQQMTLAESKLINSNSYTLSFYAVRSNLYGIGDTYPSGSTLIQSTYQKLASR